jgi:peptide/nickel transport system substrate-binding protein
MDFQWSFYTEGWGKGAIDKWDPWTLTQFAAPWFGWMPGWGEPSYWNYKNETIDKYTKAAALGKFKSKQEFIDDIRNATLLALQESVRIWIAAVDTIYPANANLQGITLDLGAGLRPPYNGRSWYIPGKNKIVVGHNWVWTAASIWNPLGGFQDVYSVDPALLTYDPLIWRHPFNGEPIPFRATYEVKTAGPNGYLEVPQDAVWWDAVHDRWVPAWQLGRTKAKSVVIFDFSKIIGTKFHDGSTITWGDVLAAIVENLEVTYDPVKSKLEGDISSSSKPILDKIVAIRILPDEKKIEVYLDYWHFDPNYIADYASNLFLNGMFLPAPIYAMMDYLAFTAKKYALGSTRSQAQKIPQLSLVEPEQVPDFVKALEQLKNMYNEYKSWFTINGVDYEGKDHWESEIEKALEWIKEYDNAWISDGPFMLVKLDKNAQVLVLKAFRDPTYPFGPTKWAFGVPMKTKIEKVLTPVVSPGEPAKITVIVKGVPPLHVLYLIRDPTTGKILAQGVAKQTPTGAFVIDLPASVTSKFAEYSAYELMVIAYSDKVALPDEKDVTLQTGAAIAKRLQEIQQAITKQVTQQVEQRISQVQQRLQQIQKSFEQRLQQLQQQFQQQLQERLGALGKELGQTLQQLLTSMTKQITQTYTQTTQTLVSQLREALTASTQQITKSVTQVSTSVTSSVQSIKSSIDTLQASIAALSKPPARYWRRASPSRRPPAPSSSTYPPV